MMRELEEAMKGKERFTARDAANLTGYDYTKVCTYLNKLC